MTLRPFANRATQQGKLVAAVACGLLVATAVLADGEDPEAVVGTATVVDSDILRVNDARIVLWGVESLERGQLCFIDGQPWECYPAAVRALETIVGTAEIRCEPVGRADAFGRIFAVCYLGTDDINELFVLSGFGLARPAETDAYVAAQEHAIAEGIGLWRSRFEPPAFIRESSGTNDRP
ncbi:MAG: thermonuclease family protein [Bauldia sp.]|nr:thermonuclease family protein [Bauldia sp.]